MDRPAAYSQRRHRSRVKQNARAAGQKQDGLVPSHHPPNQEVTRRYLRPTQGGVTDRGEAPPRGETAADRRQTMVRGLRIACRNVSVSLKDAGPRGDRLDRKGRVTS